MAISVKRHSIDAGILGQGTATYSQPLPLQQYPAYGLALKAMGANYGADVGQFVFYNDDAVLGYSLYVKRRFLKCVTVTSCFRGPIWFTDDISVQQEALHLLRRNYSPWRWNFLVLQPGVPDSADQRAFYKNMGMQRVMSGFSTAWLDIRADEGQLRRQLRGKWRNQLVKAEKAVGPEKLGVKISYKPKDYAWLIDEEAKQRQDKSYGGIPLDLVSHYQHLAGAESVFSVTINKGRAPIAGALVLCHGNSATYHIGWSGGVARSLNAQNLVLWTVITALKKKGINYIDLGGLNTSRLASLARFKLGTGARPIQFIGSYV